MTEAQLTTLAGMELLVEYALGEVSPEQAKGIEAVAAQSAAVAKRIAQVQATLTTLGLAKADAANWQVTPEQRARLIALAPAKSQSWLSRLGDKVNEAFAALVLDSRSTGQVLAGFRGGRVERHLIYRADGVEIELRISAGEQGKLNMIGHVHSNDPAQNAFLAQASDAAETVVDVDTHGMFEVGVPAGVYSLVLVFNARQIVIPSLEVAAA